jgi:uncharacterized SAM-binding protein YcdF (DUF218 family)
MKVKVHECLAARKTCLLIVLLILCLFSGCTFSRYAKRSFQRAAVERPYDAIIVPGIPYQEESTSAVMKMRLLWAKYLYDNGYAKNIIFSGSAVYSPYIESVAMKIMADSMGIPRHHIFCEMQAEHSTENVYYSWRMAKGLGFKKIVLATDPFQARMLKSFIRKNTPGIKTIPVVFDYIDLDSFSLPQIDASAAYVNDFVSIRERESWWRRVQGTMGRRVKEEKRMEARERSSAPVSNHP